MAIKRVASTVISVMICLSGITLFAQANPMPADQAQSPGQKLAGEKKFEEALPVLETEIQKSPDNADLQVSRMLALIGLNRHAEAAKLAMAAAGKFPDRKEFRFYMGECAFEMGLYQQAVQTWAAILKDKEWGALAAVESARALRSIGKEEQAISVVQESLKSMENPPAYLLRLWTSLNPSGPEGVKTAEALIKADPANREDYEAMKKLFEGAGSGRLFEEGASPSEPVTVPLKEKSERVEFSGLVWGSTASDTITTTTRVLLPISLTDGKERWMLIDSGAGEVMVSAAVVKDLALTPLATAEYIGMGYKGAQKSNWVLLKDLKVGSLSFKNVPAKVIDQKADFWEKTAGILPLSLLRKHAVQYDRRKGKLVIHPPGTKPEAVMGQGTFTVKNLWRDGYPFVETTLQGRKSSYFLLDTGAYTTFLAAQFVKELGIKVNSARYDSQTGIGLSGSFSSGVGVDAVLFLGNTKFDMPTVQVTTIPQEDRITCFGFLGRNILDLFQIFFDYSSNTIAFKPYDR